MKRVLMAVLLAAGAICLGQASPGNSPQKQKPVSPLTEYAGDWISSFDGRAWLTLHLELHDDQLSGSLVRARDYAVNDSGDLKSVSDEQVSETVTKAVLNPDGLLLTLQQPGKAETDRLLMRLTLPAKDSADLKMIAMVMPPGMPKPKPWKVTRTAIASTATSVGAPSGLAAYAGDWIARFDGKVWLLLELEIQGSKLTGTLTHSTDIELDDDGNLKSVGDVKVKETVAEATLADTGLLLTIQTTNGKEPDRYLMSLSASGKAGALGMIVTDLPTNMPMPQPWELLKFEDSKNGQAATPR